MSAFFASVFSVKTDLWEFQTLETRENVWWNEYFPLTEEDMVRYHLGKLNTPICGPQEDAIMKAEGSGRSDFWITLYLIYEKSWRMESWGLEESQTVSPPPVKVMEQFTPNVISKIVEEKKVISSSRCGFNRRKNMLSKLISSYDAMTS